MVRPRSCRAGADLPAPLRSAWSGDLRVSASISQCFELGKTKVGGGCAASLELTWKPLAAHFTLPTLSSRAGIGFFQAPCRSVELSHHEAPRMLLAGAWTLLQYIAGSPVENLPGATSCPRAESVNPTDENPKSCSWSAVFLVFYGSFLLVSHKLILIFRTKPPLPFGGRLGCAHQPG